MSKTSGEFLKHFGGTLVSKRFPHEKDISFKPDWLTPLFSFQLSINSIP